MAKKRKPERGGKRGAVEPTIGDLVVVDWRDANANVGWVPKEEAVSTLSECRSVGWFLKKTDEAISLHGEETNNGSVALRSTIPVNCVRRIQVVRGVTTRW